VNGLHWRYMCRASILFFSYAYLFLVTFYLFYIQLSGQPDHIISVYKVGLGSVIIEKRVRTRILPRADYVRRVS
jgi:hypothetical protein